VNPTPCPATTPPSGRRVLIALVLISSAASPPLSPGQIPPAAYPVEGEAVTIDSPSLRLLEIDIEEARSELDATSLWRRLIPSVRLSASVGISELYFQDDPSALVFPNDSYRITMALSLNEVFDNGPYRRALFRLERLRTQREILRRRLHDEAAKERTEGLHALRETESELRVQERIARFYRMRFEQGDLEYPTLARAELEVLTLRQRLHTLRTRARTSGIPSKMPESSPGQPEEVR
jgi:outer membrane protein TolC